MTDPSGTVGSAWQPLNKKYVEFPPPPPPSLVVLFSPSVEKKESARLEVIHRLTSSYIQIFESKKSLKCGHGGIIITRLSGYIVGCMQNIFSKVQKQSEMSNVYVYFLYIFNQECIEQLARHRCLTVNGI